MKKYKFSNRNIHRDIAYFYIGLIIAFSFSGIVLNHRKQWYPMNYTFETKEVKIDIPSSNEKLNSEAFIKEFSADWKLDNEYESHRLKGDELRVFYNNNNTILDINTKTGIGSLEYQRKVPVLGQTMFLHKTTNSFWIWYSDIFGVAMLVIAITGMLIITKGPNTFKKRGWKLALAGLLFPILILILFSYYVKSF